MSAPADSSGHFPLLPTSTLCDHPHFHSHVHGLTNIWTVLVALSLIYYSK